MMVAVDQNASFRMGLRGVKGKATTKVVLLVHTIADVISVSVHLLTIHV